MIVSVRVKTGAREDSIACGEGSREYLVSVKARPIEGEANKAIISLLSKGLGVPKSLITLDSGAKSRIKRFRIQE